MEGAHAQDQDWTWFVVVCSGLSSAQSASRCDFVVFVSQQKGDEGEEGVTSEGRNEGPLLSNGPTTF